MTCPEFHLTPEALLPEIQYSEAELLAWEHLKNEMKRRGVWMTDAAHREELNDGRLHG